jgi:hypothetical protein
MRMHRKIAGAYQMGLASEIFPNMELKVSILNQNA